MGSEKPANCPYCGAAEVHLVPAARWVDENRDMGRLSDISRANLTEALQLEVNNAPFYRDAMSRAGSAGLQAVFKYLAAIESEHASTVRKMLGVELPAPERGKEKAQDEDMANLRAAHEREVAATAFYRQSAEEASEPRVKKVFTALAGIEADHAALEEALMSGAL